MIILLALLVLISVALLWNGYTKRNAATAHQATEPPFSDDFLNTLVNTDYAKNLEGLATRVRGRTVNGSIVGNAGFILQLDNNTWAAAFRVDDGIFSAFGNGAVPQENLNTINSREFGDASGLLTANVPYANQKNNLAAEVKKCHGQTLEGLSIGNNTFNFAFANGMELDFQLCTDNNNKPAIRVFWEQW
jgi:hypothetical protein